MTMITLIVMFLIQRMFKEEKSDGTSAGVKWNCPNIHDLMRILEKVKVDLILDNVFDKRLSKVEDLSVTQLCDECGQLNLERKGKKVFFKLYSKLL